MLREMFLGAHRFDQLQAHLGIARNVLAARLRRLVEHGILTKRRYAEHPPRFEYHLTGKGWISIPALVALMQWGDHYLADPPGRADGAGAHNLRPRDHAGARVPRMRRAVSAREMRVRARMS